MDDFDHRVIGSKLDLFHIQDDAPGMIFWHPNGWKIFREVEDYVRSRMRAAGFSEIRTPQLLGKSLWEASGHWEKFGANMYSLKEGEAEGRVLCLKPMSCPCHIQVFNRRLRSYRDLPIRYAEFGACHRDEPSGSLHGLMRSKAFVQDDAHVFCSESQIESEVERFCHLLKKVYADFGFADVKVAFSTRPEKRIGSDDVWDRAEFQLSNAAKKAGLEFELQEGEGAFYGPKLEFHLADIKGRYWQCGTIQLDFVLPTRLSASFVSEQDSRQHPVLIHHAVLGGMERFIGILIEHYEGRLPNWLAPEQVLVANISEASQKYASDISSRMEMAGLRVAEDFKSNRLQRKIVDAREREIPIFAAVGDRDMKEGTVSLRQRDGSQSTLPISEAVQVIEKLCQRP